MDDQVIALSPRCIVCSRYLNQPDLPVRQLRCKHCVCYACCWDLRQGNSRYKCPIDGEECEEVCSNPDLDTMLSQYWSTSLPEVKFPLGKMLLQDLPHLINFKDVPCFALFGGSHPCTTPTCPYSHSNSQIYHKSVCPRLEKCPRKQYFCVFQHPRSEEEQDSSQGSIRYSQVDPAYISLVAKSLRVGMPQVSKQVTHVEASKEAVFFNTIQRHQEVDFGYIYIHSLSLYRHLSSNHCEVLNSLLQRFSVSAQIRTLKIICKKVLCWSYESSDGHRKNFSQEASEALELAYQNHTPEISLSPDCTVNLRLLIKIYQQKAYKPVFRTEKVLSSSHAAVLVLFAPSDTCDQVYREVQMFEQYLLIPDSVPPRAVEAIISEFGLAVSHDGWIKGIKEDLFKAGERLKSVPPPDLISHISIKPAFDKAILSQLCADFNLLPLNNILVGRISDISRLKSDDVTVTPPRLTDDSRKVISEKYNLAEIQGKWVGKLDHILDAWGEIRESRERLPSNVTSEEITRLRTGFPVLIEDGVITGPTNSVKEAIQWLMRARGITGAADQKVGNLSVDLFESWVFSQQEAVKMTEIPMEADEFAKVRARLGNNFPHTLVSVAKVYNKKLYIAYVLKRERMKAEESTVFTLEKELFYGSRTNPLDIAMSEEGFRHRYGVGSWGVGFYFAQNPAKALDYAYCQGGQGGLRQIFLCSVLTGMSVKEKSDRGLRRPPLRKDGKRYHSVEANGRGSLMWVVYEPEMAYPLYLLTIEVPKEA